MKRYAFLFLLLTLGFTVFARTAHAADFTLTPSKLAFGNQVVGTASASQNLALKNTAAGPITFTLSSLTDYVTSSSCSGTVAKGGTCTISVSFVPTVTGGRPATLTVSEGVTSIPVALSGTGVLDTTISPTTLAFGNVAEHSSSSTRTITLTNNQSVALNLISASSPNSDYTVLSPESGGCSGTLGPRASCKFTVVFTPQRLGTDNDTLVITHDAATSPQAVAITGAGVLALTVSPTSAVFAAQIEGTTSTAKTITLSNNQSNPLNTLSLSVLGNTSDFSVSGCPTPIAALGSCKLSIKFSPQGSGTFTGTLVISSPNAPGGAIQVALSGGGEPPVTVSPASPTISFAATAVGLQSKSTVITLKNNQKTALTWGTASLTGDYIIKSTTCGAQGTTLAVGGSCTYTLLFQPVVAGLRPGTLTLNDNAPLSPQVVSLSGIGIDPVSANLTSLAFATQLVGSPSPLKQVILTNHQTVTDPITESITGDFTANDDCGGVIPADSSCNLWIAFDPTATGKRAGNVTVTEASSSSQIAIALSGTGTNTPPAAVVANVSPGAGSAGASLAPVVINGTNTHFSSASILNFGTGITFSNQQCPTLTQCTSTVTIAANATPGARTVTVTTGNEVAQLTAGFAVATSAGLSFQTVSPATAAQGTQNLAVTLHANGAHFAQGTTYGNFGAGITINSLTVSDSTDAVANISISPYTPASLPTAIPDIGGRQITLVTGGEFVISALNAFQVTPDTAQIVSVSPNSRQQGANLLSVIVTGSNTNFLPGATQVSLGSGINVGAVNVLSPYRLQLDMAVSPQATVGSYNLSVSTGGEMASLANAFSVTQATPSINTVVPSSLAQCQSGNITITGILTNFVTNPPTVTFGSDITQTASLTVNSATSVTVPIQVSCTAQTGPRTGDLTSGSSSFPFPFTVPPSSASIASIVPDSGPQGGALISLKITGVNTHWVQGSTQAVFPSPYPPICPSITVNRVTVIDTLDAVLDITIPAGACLGANNFYMSTGGEILNGPFSVYAATPSVAVTPSSAMPGQKVPVTFISQFYQIVCPPTSGALTLATISGTGVYFAVPGESLSTSATLSGCMGGTTGTANATLLVAANALPGQRTITLTTGDQIVTTSFNVAAAQIVSITPYYAPPGSSATPVAIVGQNTHFGSTTTLSFGPNITVSSLSAVNSTMLNANITVASAAACGWRSAYVNTGSEQLTVSFLVNCQVPLIAGIVPATGDQGQTLSNVQVSGAATNWVQGLTTFIMGAGVTVVDTEVTSATTATLTLAVSPTAPIGPNSSTAITTDTNGNIVEVATGQGFSVTAGAGSGTLTFQASPQTAAQSETLTLTLVGTGTHWLQGETTAAFDSGISADAVTVTDETHAAIQITVLSTAGLGFHTLTAFTGGEAVALSQALNIVSTTPVLLSTVPNQAQQGATLNIQVLGESTLWNSNPANGAVTTASFGPGITVNSFLAQDSVTGLANITVDPLAYVDALVPQPCQTAIVTTGNQQVQLANQFCIVVGPAVVTSVSPTQSPLGSTLTVAVTGQNTHFRAGVTTANFGSDINTSNVQVIDTTHATVQVAVPTTASVGLHTVTMTTLGENATLAQAFTVTPQNGPTLNGVGPISGEQGQTLTAVQLIGQFTHWTSATPTVTFGQGITVSNVVVQSATSLTVNLAIDPLAQIGVRTVTVTTQLSGGAEIVSGPLFSALAGPAIISAITPSSGNQGQQVVLQITGQDTHWQQGLTQFYMPGVLDYLNDIQVNYVAVNSATSVTVNITVSPTAVLGLRSIYLTTAGEALTDARAFLITGGPAVLSVVPGNAQPGATNLIVSITGAYAHWSRGVTTVSFGAGITVESVTVNSDTNLTAVIDIDPTAAIGFRNVSVQNGSQLLSNTFQVTPPPTPFIGYYTPNSGLLGQTLTLSFSGVYTQWDPSVTAFDIGSDITVNSFQVTSLTSAIANVSIPSGAALGSRTITFTTNTETEQVQFTVLNPNSGAVQTISIVDPSSGMQGASLTVNVIGQYTTFDSTTVFDFGPGITVGTPTILGSTIANVPIAVGQLATLGYRAVTATTGGITVQSSFPVGFTVTPSTATIASVTPNTGNQGDNETQLQVVGLNTHWGSSTIFSFANGISVTNTVVTDETDATITISINPLATVGAYNLTATTSGEIATLNNAFVVLAATPVILSSGPASGPQQGSMTFTILGQATNWLQGTTSVSFGAGITINSVTVTSPTSISASGQISPTAYSGYRTVTVATGTQILTLPNAFLVTSGPATIAALTPATAEQGETLNVEVTGANTNFNQNYTVPSFGPGTSINSITVSSAIDATVNITVAPSATVQQNTVTMTTLGEVATGAQAFTIGTGPSITAVSPISVAQGATQNVTVTGTLTSFSSSTVFNFGAGVTVNQVVSINSAVSATVNITVSPIAAVGPRTVTATMGNQVAISSATVFSVAAGPASIASVTPNTGSQNTNNLAVTVTGYKTHFTQASPVVSFGPGISVTNVAVSSDTVLVATITIGQNAPVASNPVTVTTGSEAATLAGGFTVQAQGSTPSATLNPASAHEGTSQTIVITGANTNFGPTTIVSFGADIATGTLTVNGPASASVPITIDNVAAAGQRTVTITTGSQVVTAPFTVIAGVPAVTLINPNTIQPTATQSVAITGAFTNWVGGTTTANFGPGISVGGAPAGTFGPVAVNNPTSLTASLVTSGAATGSRTVQIQTGSQILTVSNGLFVETCTSTAPTMLHISPVNGSSNIPLNTRIQVQFSAPMNRSTLVLGNPGTVLFFDTINYYHEVPGTISVDASGTIATIIPSESLPAGHTFVTYLSWNSPYVQDTCGNNLPGQEYSFTTAFSPNTAGPALTGASPMNGDTNIPLSGNSSATPVVLQFNAPIDPITAQNGFSMTSGGNAVPGNFTYSANDQTVTFTPISALTASTSYTVSYNEQITDTAGNPLTNPGSLSFTTGTNHDTTTPTIMLADPPSGTFGVGLNVTPHITFSEPINQLTIPGALELVYGDSGNVIPATVTVSANRLVATLTPSAPLLPNTYYYISLCYYCYSDIAGNYGYGGSASFYTGPGAVTSPATVTTITPTNGQAGVPLNAQITAVICNTVDPTTVTNSSVTVTPSGGSAIAGTVTLASDNVTLTFVSKSVLTDATVYNVSVGGFNDINGNAVVTFTSSFTTGTTSYGSGSFTLSSTSPVNGAANVSVTSPVTFTMSNLINPASVNSQTVEVCIGNCGSEYVAGTFAVNGATVTFTPLSPYPANQVIGMYIYGLTDEAGNTAYNSAGTFATANMVDQTAPTVTISPANGASNVGLNSQVVLTFSKSINPSTISATTVSLFNGDTSLNYGYSISRDNRTVVMNPNGNAFKSGATITVALSSGIKDMSGNALANTTSQFTVAAELSNSSPSVIAMRPANGATNVPASAAVTLFTNLAMNPSTINAALNVTDNGVVVSGSVQVSSNGQAIEFTPSAPFNAGDLIQVYLNSSALSASNVALSSFSGQFTVAGSPGNTAATVQAVNPIQSATNVPLNTVIQIEYNQALAPGTITSSNVSLYQYSTGTYLTPALSLLAGGQIINIAPSGNLVSGSQYQVCLNNLTNTGGVAAQNYCLYFTAGTAVDTAAPTILSQAPTNNSTGIGTNTLVAVTFNKAIDPISVTGSTIQLSGGSTTEVPSSISFSPDYTRVSITPLAPLPASTQMTVTINGVTSQTGAAVAATSTHFTTAGQPDFTAPYVINSSVQSQQTNVPVNSPFSLQFSKPMDIGSLDDATDVGVSSNYCYGPYTPATISWSTDQTTISFVPAGPLAVGATYYLASFNLTDLDGNPQQNFCISFTTSFSANTNPTAVINTSPENNEIQVPTNAPVQILFSEPINPATISQIALATSGNPVAFTPTFSDANQLLTLTPMLPLLPNASYSLTIAGVQDAAGNKMTSAVTNTFATGPTFDLLTPQVSLTDPPNGATNVGINVAPRIVFNERLNPLSIVSSSNELYYNGSIELYNQATNQFVPATVGMSADRTTAILTPASPLESNVSYQIRVGYYDYFDVAGNAGYGSSTSFVTGAGSDTTSATVTTISPVNAQTAVPRNAQIVAIMSSAIDPTTITSSSITVTPSGGSAIVGSVTLASDGVTLTFVPATPLGASTVYNVSVGGFKDVESNAVTTFTSAFTTGTASYASGSFTLVSTNPGSGASNVPVTNPVTFTMSNLIDPASVNSQTVEVCIGNCGSEYVAGTFSVNGAMVTFTPLTQYPANQLMGMYIYGLTDQAGNAAYNSAGTFTTANTIDHTAPTVTITPGNGATNVGLNTLVVLTFSKSINPATISTSSVNLLNGDVPLNPAISISRDNRTVVLNYNNTTLPAGATITVTATNLITDLSGNALATTTGQFTTTPAVSNTAPTVISMRPGTGATGVPANTVITLFTSTPMNAGSIAGALYVSQNGVLISGATTVGSNGQSVEFTPSTALSAGASIRVFLNSIAQDIYGNSLTSFSGQFTVAGSPANTAATVQAVNPFPNANNVPLNIVLQVEYNQVLAASTINSSNVQLYQYSTSTNLAPVLSLVGNGQIINIAPVSNLVSGSQYQLCIYNVTNTDGVAAQNYCLYFTAGTTVDTTEPTILAVAPPNASSSIGTNAVVSATFNKAINPVSVTGNWIQVSGGSITEVPSSISFSPDYTRAIIIPQAPLPASTQMTIAITGVASEAGVAVSSQTTNFTTAAGADFTTPYVVNSSVQSGQTVGTNATFALRFNKPMDKGSVDGATYLGISSNYCYGPFIAATVSWSTDQTTIFFVPTTALTASTTYYLSSFNLTDLAGNPQQNFCVSFNTGTGTETAGPVVQQVSPPSGFMGVPVNAPVQILFNEAISPASLAGVTLNEGSSVVPTTISLFDGNKGLQVLPQLPLAAGTVYTINITGVVDFTGNAQSSFASQSFTTGAGVDLLAAAVVSTSPTNAQTTVPDNATIQVVFSEAMGPASFDPSTSFTLHDSSNNVVPATITFSADYKTVTLHPTANLTGSGATYTMYVGWPYVSSHLYDLGGNSLYGTYFEFTTQ